MTSVEVVFGICLAVSVKDEVEPKKQGAIEVFDENFLLEV